MTEMFGEAWSPVSVPDLAPDDDDEEIKARMSVLAIYSQRPALQKCKTADEKYVAHIGAIGQLRVISS